MSGCDQRKCPPRWMVLTSLASYSQSNYASGPGYNRKLFALLHPD